MNQGMWAHPATLENMALLEQRGVRIFGPDSGVQACGDIGPGRMQQPQRSSIRSPAASQVRAER